MEGQLQYRNPMPRWPPVVPPPCARNPSPPLLSHCTAQAAMRTLHQLLSMAAAGGVAGLAAVLQQWPAPSPAAVAAADLPTVAGEPGQGAAGGCGNAWLWHACLAVAWPAWLWLCDVLQAWRRLMPLASSRCCTINLPAPYITVQA